MTGAAAKAFICGCAGPRLNSDERAFLSGERPFGLILFQRNCRDPQEIRDLAAGFRAAVGRADAPVLIDQEGGRVQRLKPPHWPSYAGGADDWPACTKPTPSAGGGPRGCTAG